MRQTEHHGLNQWELTDRILMADFNADNAKIAAALAGKLGPLEELPHTRFECEGGFSGRGFSALSWNGSWTDWAFTIATFRPWDLEAAQKDTLIVETNHGSRFTIQGGSFLVIFAAFHDPSRDIQGLFLSSSVFQFFRDDAPFLGYTGGTLRDGSNLNGYTSVAFGVR